MQSDKAMVLAFRNLSPVYIDFTVQLYAIPERSKLFSFLFVLKTNAKYSIISVRWYPIPYRGIDDVSMELSSVSIDTVSNRKISSISEREQKVLVFGLPFISSDISVKINDHLLLVCGKQRLLNKLQFVWRTRKMQKNDYLLIRQNIAIKRSLFFLIWKKK